MTGKFSGIHAEIYRENCSKHSDKNKHVLHLITMGWGGVGGGGGGGGGGGDFNIRNKVVTAK